MNGIYANCSLKEYKKLAKGFDVVFCNEKNMKKAKKAGLEVFVCKWVFKSKDGIVNSKGKKVLWLSAGCPNNPNIRKNFLRKIQAYENLVLDGIRFPSPASKDAFFSCYCEYCKQKAKELGLDLEINLNKNAEWIKFRIECITQFVKEIRENFSGKLAAALFTPSLAYLVGQAYKKLYKHLDFIQPMIYHKGKGAACIRYEVKCLKEIWKNKIPKEILELEKLKDLKLIENELNQIIKLRKKLTPIIFILNSSRKEVEEIKNLILSKKFKGIIYFCFHQNFLRKFS